VCKVAPHPEEDACQVVPLDGSKLSYAWRDNGQSNKFHESATDAVEDATVTLPLKNGQQVWTRCGKLATVREATLCSVAVIQTNGSAMDTRRTVYRDIGRNYRREGSHSAQDVVADA
jgi:hypothetical protein